MDRKSMIAILASLIWVALATGLILGTHGPAVTAAESAEAPVVSTQWQSLPAANLETTVHIKVPKSC